MLFEHLFDSQPDLARRELMRRLAAAAWLAGGVAPLAAQAQGLPFPSRPVKLVTPFPAASVTDQIARPLGHQLSELWKQPVIIDNRSGAGGIIGVQAVATAAPDGYSLLVGSNGTHAILPALSPRLPFDPVKNFEPVSTLVSNSLMLVVHPSVNARSVAELIALAKAKPGQLTFASGGVGTTPHLAGELFNSTANVKMTHIGYKGSPPSVLDLVAGRVDMIFANPSTVQAHVKAGKLRPLAVTSLQPDPRFPDLPTVSRDLPGYTVDVWVGIFAPAGTPAPIIAKLSEDIRTVLTRPEIVRQLSDLDFAVAPSTPQQMAARLGAEIQKWAKVVKDAGIKVE